MKPEKLTHTEACKMVEDALERVGKTLAYIRCRLEKPYPNGSERTLWDTDMQKIEEANLLCNINIYGAYLKGAKTAITRLKDHHMLHIAGEKFDKEDKFTSKAHLDLYMKSARNLEWFLHGMPSSVRINTYFERDKKGKVIGATSSFVKKKTTYEEI